MNTTTINPRIVAKTTVEDIGGGMRARYYYDAEGRVLGWESLTERAPSSAPQTRAVDASALRHMPIGNLSPAHDDPLGELCDEIDAFVEKVSLRGATPAQRRSGSHDDPLGELCDEIEADTVRQEGF